MSHDVILEQVEFTYESARNVIQTVTRLIQLTAMKDAITNKTFAQCWQLDATGNWKNFRQDDDGNGTWDLNQTRTDNKVNEITDITETAGPSWVTPAYNRAGNMTTVPKPSDPTQSYTATYDGWNRLVRMEEGADKMAEYEYDGAKRRTVQKTYTAGVLSETRHLYYTEPSKWQVIEERTGTSPDSANAERQFVWGLRYIDDLVLRDRDTDGNGSLDERLYALQDANWNVTAITNASGSVQERYAYTAYGVPSFWDASFGLRGSSSYQWETLFAGYRWDAATRQFHVRNRIYSPTVGTWLQRDPFGLLAGLNLYEYCASNPSLYLDEDGLLLPVLLGPAIILAFILGTPAFLCASGCIGATLGDLSFQVVFCLLKQCWKGQWPKPAKCFAQVDICQAAISCILGCILNIVIPGVGPLAVIVAGALGGAVQQMVKKVIAKALAIFLAKMGLKQFC